MPYKDPAVKAAYLLEYMRNNRGRYVERQRARDSAKNANLRAERYGAPGRITVDEAFDILAVGHCHYCPSSERLGLDHVIPLHEGGLNRLENIVACCAACNSSKWRQDRPGRWSRLHDQCVQCSTTEHRHICHGLCTRCFREQDRTRVR